MSLFGGDSAPPSESSYESESEQSQPAITQNPPAPVREPTPQPAQSAQDFSSDPDADFDSESASESDVEEPSRPNRFQGQRSTWRNYTAEDRQLAASLEQIQNSDLAAHLYNAHALKRRVRRPTQDLAELKGWQSNEVWLKKGDELRYTDVSGEIQTRLVPTKEWTAWPLPLAELPRPDQEPDRGASAGGRYDWTIGGAGGQDAGDEIREELLAVFLRQAKERWNSRETDHTLAHAPAHTARSRSRSRSKSVKSSRSRLSASRHGIDLDDDDDLRDDRAETQGEDEDKFEHTNGRRRGRVAQSVTLVNPVFLADDAKAQRILEPMINSIMGKVDDLALAIRRTRFNHFGRKDYSDRSSHSEWTSGVESGARTPKRSRNQSKSRPGSRQSSRPVSRATSVRSGPRTAKASLINGGTSSDSESDSESDVTMADIKVESFTKKRRRPSSTADERSPSATRDETSRAGLMDWSEVLGLAAVKGWDERVVARAAQRCATLFGESMSFVPLEEEHATKPVPERVQYTPSTIPPPEIMASVGFAAPKRPFFQTGTWRCPHADCYGYNKDFESPHRVVEHCRRVHGYDPRTNDSDNEDRAFGGVHIDGFLRPVVAQRGWVERGKSKAGSEKKRQKTVPADNVGADVAITIESD
jgi:hypothetical protein